MPAWRRNHRDGPPPAALPPAASPPAALPPAAARDDWRTLPPLPTVLRSPVTTVAVEAFSDSLGTWRNPSFLAPLGHQIDPDGPAGLVTGLAGAPASPEPRTYYRDRPLTLADAAPVPLQRSAATSAFPPPGRSQLTTAPDVDLSPVPLPAVPEDAVPAATVSRQAAFTEAREPDAAEPETPGPAPDPPANQGPEPPAPSAEPLAIHLDPSRPPEQPLIAQRQITATPPPPPPARRLGIGRPLAADSTPAKPASTPAKPASTPANQPVDEPAQDRPVVASELPPAAPAPWPPMPPAPPDPIPAPAASVQRVLPDQPRPSDPALSHDPGPPDDPAPPYVPEPSRPAPAQAPLLGHPQQVAPPIQPATPTVRPLDHPPASTVAPPKEPLPPLLPLASTTPSPPPSARLAVQRSAALPDPSPSHGHPPVPLPLADPGPADTQEPPPAHPDEPTEPTVSVQRHAPAAPQLAPLLAHRPPPRILDGQPDTRTAPQHQPPTAIPATATGAHPVQRAVSVAPPFSRPGRPAPSAALRPAPANQGPLDTYSDPGAIAVARGLAHRDADGSVVFGLGPAALASSLTPSRKEPASATITSPPGTGPRQEPAEPAPEPASTIPATASATPPTASAAPPAMAATSTVAPAQAPAATSPAGPPPTAAGATQSLDELARQLFGPLTARLKAELRLDRERAGLLTDLRQ